MSYIGTMRWYYKINQYPNSISEVTDLNALVWGSDIGRTQTVKPQDFNRVIGDILSASQSAMDMEKHYFLKEQKPQSSLGCWYF